MKEVACKKRWKNKYKLALATIGILILFVNFVAAATNWRSGDCIYNGSSYVTKDNYISGAYTTQTYLFDSSAINPICKNVVTAKYKITYNANGGSGTMASTTHDYGVASPLSANNFTRVGYTFKGWTENSDGSGTLYPNGASYTGACGSHNCNINLYAQWQVNYYTYKIEYRSENGGRLLGTDTIREPYGTIGIVSSVPIPGYISPQSMNVNWDVAKDYGKTITFTYTPITYELTYDFISEDLSNRITPRISLSSHSLSANDWREKGELSIIHFNQNPGTYQTASGSVSFSGFKKYMEPGKKYRIYFDFRKESGSVNISAPSGSLKAQNGELSFTMTSTSNDLLEFNFTSIFAAQDRKTINIPLRVTNFRIVELITFDDYYSSPGINPIPEDHIGFDGWYKIDGDPNSRISSSMLYNVPSNSTVYARWENSITYLMNGGTNIEGMKTSYLDWEQYTLPTNTTRRGYVFDGWSDIIDFPKKGDIITLDDNLDTNGDVFTDQFRVIKVDGSKIEVLAMFNYASVAFNTSNRTYGYIHNSWDSKGDVTQSIKSVQWYRDSTLDRTMTEFYKKLPEDIQESIIEQDLFSEVYDYAEKDNGNRDIYMYKNDFAGTLASPNSFLTWAGGVDDLLFRDVYALGVNDIKKYLGTSHWNAGALNEMFTGSPEAATTKQNIFLRDVRTTRKSGETSYNQPLAVVLQNGYVTSVGTPKPAAEVHPAFTIDLSKYSKMSVIKKGEITSSDSGNKIFAVRWKKKINPLYGVTIGGEPYTVVSKNGNQALVVSIRPYSSTNVIKSYFKYGGTTVAFDNGKKYRSYAGSTLDNTAIAAYDKLLPSVQNAIIEQEIYQSAWKYTTTKPAEYDFESSYLNTSSPTFSTMYKYVYGDPANGDKKSGSAKTYYMNRVSQIYVGPRKVFALDIDDVKNDISFSGPDSIGVVFFGASDGYYPKNAWTRSADVSKNANAMTLNPQVGRVAAVAASDTSTEFYPAFVIDFSLYKSDAYALQW